MRCHLLGVVVVGLLVHLSQVAEAGDERLPIPSALAQKKAAALVQDLYKSDLTKAQKDPDAKGLLAVTFLQEAKDTSDYPAGRYVLLVEARKLATQAGDAPIALQATDDLAQDFAVPADEVLGLKVQTIGEAIEFASTPGAYHTIVDSALVLLEDALADDDYDASRKLLTTADAAALKLKSVPLVTSIRRRHELVARLEKEYARWKPFADTLRKNTKDEDANLVMGKYQAFYKGDWDKGLPHLAQGKDAELRKLAALDLGRPTDASAQIELAEGWLKASRDVPEAEKTQLLLRAYYWYVQSLADLKAASRGQVEEQMETINKLLPADYRAGEISSETRVLVGHSGPVYAVAVSADGRRAISGGADNVLRLWDTKTGKEIRRLPGHTGRVWTVAFSPDGRRAASAGFDKVIRLWDLASGREIRQFSGHTDYIRSVSFSRDGKRILSGGDDRSVRLWNTDTGAEIRSFPGHDHFVWSVAISPDGQQAISGSLDKTVRVWDLKSGQEVRRLNGHKDTVLSVAFSPDGRRALSGSTDNTLILWDLQAAKPMRTLVGHTGYVNDVVFSPDGRRALSASADRTVRLWDVYSGEAIRALDAHRDAVWSVSFSRDGRLALSGGQDHTVRVWGSTN